jgi:hypothetical protein
MCPPKGGLYTEHVVQPFLGRYTSLGHPQGVPLQLIGKRVSRYRVLDVLGGGGMGVVYRVENIKLSRMGPPARESRKGI